MFSQACVILFTGGGGRRVHPTPVDTPPSGSTTGCTSTLDASPPGCSRCTTNQPPTPARRQAVGTHPTGMHTCFCIHKSVSEPLSSNDYLVVLTATKYISLITSISTIVISIANPAFIDAAPVPTSELVPETRSIRMT